MGKIFHRIQAGYRATATMLLSTLLLFLLLNLIAAWALSRGFGSGPAAGALTYGMETLRQVYPGYDEKEVHSLISEVATRPQIYEPFTQFKEGPTSGRYLNVNEHGFRLGGVAKAWPPETDGPSIFIFGGSTAFGYGLADKETIPARLEQALAESELDGSCIHAPRVYNFARPNYYSSQERVLFERLLVAGARPDLAIFIDGLNEFIHPEDAPKYTSRLSYMMGEGDLQLARRTIKSLPLIQILRALSRRQEVSSRWQNAASADAAKEILERWQRNRMMSEAIAKVFAVETLFVWQPVPVYGYDLSNHPFATDDTPLLPEHDLIARAYELMAESDVMERMGGVWLGDLQWGRKEALYVDRVHYTAAFSQDIATSIATAINTNIAASLDWRDCEARSVPTASPDQKRPQG